NSHPDRRSHDIVRHANALALEIGQACDARLRVHEESEPNKRFGWKDRQCRPLPAIATGALARDEIFGPGHFKDIKLIVLQVAEKKLRRRRDGDIEIESW